MTDARDRATLPLLTRITSQALDEDYAELARRRRSGGLETRPRSASWWSWLAVTVLGGGLLAVAGAQTSEQAVTSQSGRTTLISRIDTRRDVLSRVQTRVGRLKAANARRDVTIDGATAKLAVAEAELRRVRIRTGHSAVRGPGVSILVDGRPSGRSAEAVRDEDLALLVNGLWTAGAEAVAINGQRLTALSYIQNSGPAINVNSRALIPPYTVEAVGDPRTLQANLLDSSSGARFNNLARLLGFRFERQNVDQLTLPGAPLRRLRSAASGLSGEPPTPIDEGGAR